MGDGPIGVNLGRNSFGRMHLADVSQAKEFLMTFTIDKLAKTLQTLFTTEADTAAKESGMIQRRRKISGAGFVQSLVFGWLDDPTTTIDELGDELDVTKQGLDQRLDARAADCLWRVVKKALHRLFAASPETIPLLRRFTGVVIDDCTSLGLPAELARRFPGCGGSDPEAGQAGLSFWSALRSAPANSKRWRRARRETPSTRWPSRCRRCPWGACTWPTWVSSTSTS